MNIGILLSFLLVAAAGTPHAAAPSRDAAPAYSSMLRVGVHVLFDRTTERELWTSLDARPEAFDELMIFTQNNHAVRPLSYHRRNAPRVAKFLRDAEKRGYRTGVNIIPTIGFGTDAYDPQTAYLPAAVRTDNGQTSPGRLCRTAPETLEFIREVYGIYAATRPQFIYVDDDVSAGPCQCPRCCRAALGVADRQAMHAKFASDDLAVRRAAAGRWLKFAEDGVNGVFAAAAEGTWAVDPKIALGFMTYTCGDIGHDPRRWATTLAGGNGLGSVRWRPGGGAHNDYSFMELVRKTLAMAMQITGLPDEVTLIQGEIENFPFHTLRKSPSYMNFEALLYLATGCTGIAWDIDGFNGRDAAASMPYYAAADRIRPAAQRVVAAFGRSPSDGVAFPWTNRSGMRLAEKGFIEMAKGVRLPKELAAVGIPVASDPKRARVVLLDRSSALELSDDELRRVLSGAALLDAEALETVNARGFGALTGFKVSAEKPPVDAISRDLDHPLNAEGRSLCDVRQCFGFCKPVVAIEKTDDKAEYTGMVVDYDGNPAGGYAGGVFENSAGGRVAVEALSAFAWYESRPRSIHLKRLMRWLSRDGLDAYLASFHRAMVIARSGGVFAANLANEPMVGGEVAVRGGEEWKVCVFGGGAIISESLVRCARKDGGYAVLKLPEIPVNGEALIVPCRRR